MQETRQRILEHLRLAHGARVGELSELLGLTATGIRQHLAVLEHEGLIASEAVRGGVGRPPLRYFVTSEGESLFPKGYDALANALIDELREAYGDEGLQRITSGVARRLADPSGAEVPTGPAPERLDRAVASFQRRGIATEWERDGDTFLLHEHTCPFPDAARAHPEICDMDVEQVRVLTGMSASLESCSARGAAFCTYRLAMHEAADGSARPEAG